MFYPLLQWFKRLIILKHTAFLFVSCLLVICYVIGMRAKIGL